MANTTKKKSTATTSVVSLAKTIKTTTETPAVQEVKEVKPVMTRYKFIANCDNLNVSNVIFNNIKVVIYEVDAPNYDAAFNSFQQEVIKMFNGNTTKYNMFMKAVFGDDILVESVAVENIKQDIAIIK